MNSLGDWGQALKAIACALFFMWVNYVARRHAYRTGQRRQLKKARMAKQAEHAAAKAAGAAGLPAGGRRAAVRALPAIPEGPSTHAFSRPPDLPTRLPDEHTDSDTDEGSIAAREMFEETGVRRRGIDADAGGMTPGDYLAQHPAGGDVGDDDASNWPAGCEVTDSEHMMKGSEVSREWENHLA